MALFTEGIEGMPVRLGIHRLRLLGPGGEHKEISNVFCPRHQRTMNLATCLACSRLVRAAEDSIECVAKRDESLADAGAQRLGGDVCVGDATGCATVCVLADVAPAVLANAMKEQGAAFAVVVETPDRVLGLVDLEAAILASEGVSVGHLARQVFPVREAAPLAFAVERMVHERLRALPVIDDQGSLVAILSDIDALRWVARRTSTIPEEARERNATAATTATMQSDPNPGRSPGGIP